ncbi:zinc finger protein Xfin-like [Leptopilina heterotoma]|uniref:zinc finger protein Xfin-like n=1 Tax=Leptopilina heterotoma TaxID=63436 RepID=UPI001CA80194|nr:zinc finger protein Xfin-like [Leptopilina heterotoma]
MSGCSQFKSEKEGQIDEKKDKIHIGRIRVKSDIQLIEENKILNVRSLKDNPEVDAGNLTAESDIKILRSRKVIPEEEDEDEGDDNEEEYKEEKDDDEDDDDEEEYSVPVIRGRRGRRRTFIYKQPVYKRQTAVNEKGVNYPKEEQEMQQEYSPRRSKASKRRGRGRTFIYAQNTGNPSRKEENLPESANEIIDIDIPEHLRIERVGRPRAFLYKQSTSTVPATKTEVIEDYQNLWELIPTRTNVPKKRRGRPSEGPYICGNCGKLFHLKIRFSEHQRKECGGRSPSKKRREKKYSCSTCNRCYVNYRDLVRHQRYICQKEPQFACNYCDRKFYHRYRLTYHLVSLHPGEGKNSRDLIWRYTFLHLRTPRSPADGSKNSKKSLDFLEFLLPSADGCWLSSPSVSGYYVNQDLSCQDGQGQKIRYHCPNCDKSYSQEGNLKRHRKMECGGKKTFVCNICQRGFTRKLNLQQHLFRQTFLNLFGNQPNQERRFGKSDESSNKRRFQCPNCEKSYTLQHNLAKHMRLECGGQFYLQLYCDTLPRDVWHRCKTDLLCLKCKKPYSDWRSLRKHMNYFCKMEPLYPCPFCTHRARLNTLLKYHIIKEHSSFVDVNAL